MEGNHYSVAFHKRKGLFSHQGVLWKKLSGSKIKMSWIWGFVMNSTQVYKEGLQSLKDLEKVQIDTKRVVDLLFCCVSLGMLSKKEKNLNSPQ